MSSTSSPQLTAASTVELSICAPLNFCSLENTYTDFSYYLDITDQGLQKYLLESFEAPQAEGRSEVPCGSSLSINPNQLYKNPPTPPSIPAPKRKLSMSTIAEGVQKDAQNSKRSRPNESAQRQLSPLTNTQTEANITAPLQPRYPKIFSTGGSRPLLRSVSSNPAIATLSDDAIPRRYSTHSGRNMLQVPGKGDLVSWPGSLSMNYVPKASERPHTESPAPPTHWDQTWPPQSRGNYPMTSSPGLLHNMSASTGSAPSTGFLPNMPATTGSALSTGFLDTYSPPNTMAHLHHSHTFPVYGPIMPSNYGALPPSDQSSTFPSTHHSRRGSHQDPTTTVIQRVTSFQARQGSDTSQPAPTPAPAPTQAPIDDHNDDRDNDKPRCWDHGCSGREFSTFSNLLRHQREKAGTASKSCCPHCGAEFTRTTARNSHARLAKCRGLARGTP